MIVNTAGWDTDCNSGNVGCLLGIKNGLAGDRAATGAARWPTACTSRPPTAGGRSPTPPPRRSTSSTPAGAGGRAAVAGRRASTSRSRARCRASTAACTTDGALAVDGVATTPTFIPREALAHHRLRAAGVPDAVPGPDRAAVVEGAPARLLVRVYGEADELVTLRGPEGAHEWRIPTRAAGRSPRSGVETHRPGAAALADVGRRARG